MVNMNILMNDMIRCPEDTFKIAIFSMIVYDYVWIYTRIPVMQSGISDIEIWSRSRCETMS